MAFLIEEFGQDRGSALFDTQEQLFHTLIESKNAENKSKRQQKTLIQTILPCVALYKTLLQEGFSEEKTSAYLQKYMFTIVVLHGKNGADPRLLLPLQQYFPEGHALLRPA